MNRQRLQRNKVNVLGIDLGLNNTGLCSVTLVPGQIVSLFQGVSVHAFGMAKTKLTNWPKQRDYIRKYFIEDKYIYSMIHKADLVCIEKPFGIQGHGKVLINLLGILQLLFVSTGTAHVEVAQTTLKKFATGNGRAEKSEIVLKAYKGKFGTDLIRPGDSFEARSEDEVDAFFLSMIGHCLLNPESFDKSKQELVKKLKVLR